MIMINFWLKKLIPNHQMNAISISPKLSVISEVSESWEASEHASPAHNKYFGKRKSQKSEFLELIREESEIDMPHSPSQKTTIHSGRVSMDENMENKELDRLLKSRIIQGNNCSCTCSIF
ncbi:unnamed protein product [Blepharisma stoltei]|uniref:Uncharacterized protein n=1 Tax=Blepharisma stoltei TaxID=1481888 RepID=A0AAU9JKH4_9CILI|nr:unnamed protein product [Blepharisma stoltei]